MSRIEVLSRQFANMPLDSTCLDANPASARIVPDEERPAPGGGRGTLSVTDNRTGKQYTVSLPTASPSWCFDYLFVTALLLSCMSLKKDVCIDIKRSIV